MACGDASSNEPTGPIQALKDGAGDADPGVKGHECLGSRCVETRTLSQRAAQPTKGSEMNTPVAVDNQIFTLALKTMFASSAKQVGLGLFGRMYDGFTLAGV
jgi:hypothetical protein